MADGKTIPEEEFSLRVEYSYVCYGETVSLPASIGWLERTELRDDVICIFYDI